MLDQNFIQIILTILCGFALSLFLGWLIIPVLRRLKAGQEIREVGPNWHATKAGTPTMGGLTFIGASLLCLVFGIRHMKQGDFSALYVLVCTFSSLRWCSASSAFWTTCSRSVFTGIWA